MRPLVYFPDARIKTLAVLRATLPLYAPTATAGTLTPEALIARDAYSGPPYLMVALDAAATEYPVLERATVRVVAWGDTDASSLQLAQTARAVLLTYPGGPGLHSFGEGIGPTPAVDPDSDSPLASFTVEARLRPVPLLSA